MKTPDSNLVLPQITPQLELVDYTGIVFSRLSAWQLWAAVRSLLIVGVLVFYATQASAQDLQAVQVCGWDFGRKDDANFDQRADGWKRRQDRQHPAYIDMRLQPRNAETAAVALEAQGTLTRLHRAWTTGRWDPNFIPESTPTAIADFLDVTILNNCLEITMDGGAAELVSPRFPMDSRFSYSLHAEMSCLELDGHEAWVELHLLDDSGETLEVLPTGRMHGTQPWKPISTEVATDPGPRLSWGQIHLKVSPHDAMMLAGNARFDSIRIYRMPRLGLHVPLPYHIARPGEPFEVTCKAMGISGLGANVRFELYDCLGAKLREESVPLHASQRQEFRVAQDQHNSEPARPHYISSRATEQAFDGSAVWNLTLDEHGLYRVRVNLGKGSHQFQHREVLVGVVSPGEIGPAGPFGWSLPAFGPKLQPEQVPDLVRTFGVGWVKMPVWFDIADTESADRLLALAEKLQLLGTECVGLIDQPPVSQRAQFGDGSERLYAAHVFSDPEIWDPLLEPVLSRMGMKLTWFQLGADDDASFLGNPKLLDMLSAIRTRMQSYSQELKLTLGWTWLDSPPSVSPSPWSSMQFTASPQLTAAELAYYVPKRLEPTETWVTINPLDADKYSLLDRVRDLTERMITIRRSAVTAAFVDDPFKVEYGLFTPQRTVGEMLIPWRTLVSSIGAADYIGSIELPGGSTNHIFQNGEEGIMLLWNDSSKSERAFLGNAVEAADIWGRTRAVRTVTNREGMSEQLVSVDAWPIVIHGIDINVIRFRQRFELQVSNLASKIGSTQTIPLIIENTLPQSTSGRVAMVSDSLLTDGLAEMKIQIPAGRQQTRDLPVVIRNDASAGSHQVRFDFDLVSDKAYRFTIYRAITLGLGDVEILWDHSRIDDAMVQLRIELINNTDSTIGFDCKLFPPGRPYQGFQILEAEPGSNIREVKIPLAASSQEREMWIRCEQIGSGRILNYRVKL